MASKSILLAACLLALTLSCTGLRFSNRMAEALGLTRKERKLSGAEVTTYGGMASLYFPAMTGLNINNRGASLGGLSGRTVRNARPTRRPVSANNPDFPAVLAQASAPAPPPPDRNFTTPPPPPPSPGGSTCPPSASECDFYFDGFQNQVPTFKVYDNTGDIAISPPIMAQVKGSNVDVIAVNSQQSTYPCATPSSGLNPTVGVNPDNQFYGTQDKVQSRTFQPATGGIAPFVGKYVKLPLTSVEMNLFNMVINLNPGEANSYFPEDRRCVIFQVEAGQ